MSARAEPDPDGLAGAVTGQPGVARLHSGRFGEVATYLPGRKVSGVEIGADRVSVHVVASYGARAPDVADAVRQAAAPFAAGLAIDVVVEDIEDPPGEGADGRA